MLKKGDLIKLEKVRYVKNNIGIVVKVFEHDDCEIFVPEEGVCMFLNDKLVKINNQNAA